MSVDEFDGWGFGPGEVQGAPRVVMLTVPGDPLSKGRPRLSRAGHAYTPKTTRDAEAVIALAWDALNVPPFEGRVGVDIKFYQQSKRAKDVDNMVKLVLDALNGVAWVDDSQVDVIHVRRVFNAGPAARTVISVRDWFGE
jgi:hypothetical protein